MVANKEGIFTLISPYDGSKLKLNYLELNELIQHLKPDAVILPPKTVQEVPGIWDNWNDAITPFIAADDLLKQELQRPHGVSLNWNKESFRDIFGTIKKMVSCATLCYRPP